MTLFKFLLVPLIGLVPVVAGIYEAKKKKEFSIKAVVELVAGLAIIVISVFDNYRSREKSVDIVQLNGQLQLAAEARRIDSINNANFQKFLRDSLGLIRDGNEAGIINRNSYDNFSKSEGRGLSLQIQSLEAQLKAYINSQSKKPVGDPAIPVKQQALTLATELLKFVEVRNENTPRAVLPPPGADMSWVSPDFTQFKLRSMELYRELYQDRVKGLHERLQEMGIVNIQFNSLYNRAVDLLGVRKIGEAVADLAKELPE